MFYGRCLVTFSDDETLCFGSFGDTHKQVRLNILGMVSVAENRHGIAILPIQIDFQPVTD